MTAAEVTPEGLKGVRGKRDSPQVKTNRGEGGGREGTERKNRVPEYEPRTEGLEG